MKPSPATAIVTAGTPICALAPTMALAHSGAGDASGLVYGFMHPIGGLDHVLAMVAVGVFAAFLRGRARWLVPLTFVIVMALGGMAGMAGSGLPFAETGIALSTVVFGAAIALRWQWPAAAATALVGIFALFHGYAHGAEMPQSISGVEYAAGFMAATALLHVLGIGIGLSLGKAGDVHAQRAALAGGIATSLIGLALLTGVA